MVRRADTRLTIPPLELGERIGQLNVDDIVRLSHAVFLGLAGA